MDYLLFGGGRPIGVVEAKKVGAMPSGVEPQAKRYCANLPEGMQQWAWHDPPPFRYESTGVDVVGSLKDVAVAALVISEAAGMQGTEIAGDVVAVPPL